MDWTDDTGGHQYFFHEDSQTLHPPPRTQALLSVCPALVNITSGRQSLLRLSAKIKVWVVLPWHLLVPAGASVHYRSATRGSSDSLPSVPYKTNTKYSQMRQLSTAHAEWRTLV